MRNYCYFCKDMWALVDCDNFFCSCERAFRPDLNDRPVVVLSNNDGCVVARSAETKAMGIAMGMPYFKMLQEFAGRGIVAFSSNYTLYGDMSARVIAVLRDAAPEVLQYSIDEAFLDLRGIDNVDLKKWGEDLARRVRQWTGIPVSIGIAPTKTLAKMASRFAKRYPGYNKCCLIATDEQRRKALSLFEVGDVWGIGRRIAKSLAAKGITTAAQFADKPREWVRAKYHVTGERTWAELRGVNAVDVDSMDGTTHKSIMTSRSFPGMITELTDLRTHVSNYAARCAAKLRRQHTVCGMLMVFVQANYFRPDLPYYSNSATAQFSTATANTTEIVELAGRVLECIFRPGIHYKRAGVMVSDISPDDAVQPDLFEFDADQSRRYRSISEVIDRINERLGTDTVILASQQYAQKDESGKNIGFSQAIRRSLKSPDYSTRPDSFKVK